MSGFSRPGAWDQGHIPVVYPAPRRRAFGLRQLCICNVLTPASAPDLIELAARLLGWEADYRLTSGPFRGKFTRQDFDRRLQELAA